MYSKNLLVVSNQVVTNPCCSLAVIIHGFTLLLIGHGFTGMTVNVAIGYFGLVLMAS